MENCPEKVESLGYGLLGAESVGGQLMEAWGSTVVAVLRPAPSAWYVRARHPQEDAYAMGIGAQVPEH